MAKIPYLIRRKNVFYFRLGVPAALREIVKSREIIKSLKTEDSEEATRRALKLAAHFKTLLHDLKTGKTSEAKLLNSWGTTPDDATPDNCTQEPRANYQTTPSQPATGTRQAPLLSLVVDDFLKRYDQSARVMLGKLKATLPIFVEMLGNKPINEIFQTNINEFFDDVQKLPVRRVSEKFKGLSIKEVIAANTGPTISEKTFKSNYRACVSVFLNWANTNYKDQGFPTLSVQGADYRGERGNGINKQRAASREELDKLFNNPKMEKYATNSETVHYFWLPLIGLYTGARINEICQLNPSEDIRQDSTTGIWYFHFTDESETAEGVSKSIKTNSSRRIVPIHSTLIDLGFLDYVEKIKTAGHKIIFPEWQPRNGKASANASKWFTRYLESIGLRDDTEGARLSGFHSFRHTLITYAMQNRIAGVFAITGHEVETAEGFSKISEVAKGYWTRGITDDVQARKETIEKFDFGLSFQQPKA